MPTLSLLCDLTTLYSFQYARVGDRKEESHSFIGRAALKVRKAGIPCPLLSFDLCLCPREVLPRETGENSLLLLPFSHRTDSSGKLGFSQQSHTSKALEITFARGSRAEARGVCIQL